MLRLVLRGRIKSYTKCDFTGSSYLYYGPDLRKGDCERVVAHVFITVACVDNYYTFYACATLRAEGLRIVMALE